MPPERPGSADHADHGREARSTTPEARDGLRDDSPSQPVIVRTSLALVLSLVAVVYLAGRLALLDLTSEVLPTLVVKYAGGSAASTTQQLQRRPRHERRPAQRPAANGCGPVG